PQPGGAAADRPRRSALMNIAQTRPTGGFGIMAPTRDQIVSTYRSIAESAMKNGTLEQLDGPPVTDVSKWPRYDITPDGLQDVNRAVFNIQGTLYLQTSSLFGPGPGPYAHWAKIGPAPMF